MMVRTEDVPHVSKDKRLAVSELGKGFYAVTVRYGFMDHPHLPRALKESAAGGSTADRLDEHLSDRWAGKIIAAEPQHMLPRWRKQLFILMNKLSLDATEFFCIPPNRVVEVSGQIEI